MDLKALIKKMKIRKLQRLPSEGVTAVFTMPEEPSLYSLKYELGSPSNRSKYERDPRWKNILKAFFNSYLDSRIPVVLQITFFVSPPTGHKISQKSLKDELTPATLSFELADYLLFFLETIHSHIIATYKQVVKIEMQKIYSAKPRTEFKFMRYDHYVDIHNSHPVYACTEDVSKIRQIWSLQPFAQGHEQSKSLRGRVRKGDKSCALPEAITNGYPFSHATRPKLKARRTPSARIPTARDKARRR